MKKKIFLLISIAIASMSAWSQTLNVRCGDVTYQFPSIQAGEMPYTDSSTLTILGKSFAVDGISEITVDDSNVADNTVSITYSGTSAKVNVAGNIARYITPTISGAHVSIEQSSEVSDEVGEITYTLSGTSSDGELYLTGSYKCTVELAGVTLTNPSGAAINIQNGKRVDISVKKDTDNTLTDGSNGEQKACLVVKGHAELKGKGTLTIYGNSAHGIKSGEYMTVKNCTINVKKASKDGIHCNEYFLMESGTLDISGVGDDGIQVEIDGTTSTGETTGHEDEDSGSAYITDGNITISVTATAAKGIKADGDVKISGGTITATTSGGGEWDSDSSKTKAPSCISSDGNTTISGGTLMLTSTGGGGKGLSGDGSLSVSGGNITITTSGGVVIYTNGSINNNYTGNTDRYSSNYKSSPKGIKYDGDINISGGTISVTAKNHEGIESKGKIDISGGQTYSCSSDDAINSSSHLTISDGYVCGYSTGNDGIDANGNCYIKGGVVYAIGSRQPEVGIDANTEGGYKLYVSGGTLIAIGGLESGSSLTQSCYSASWSSNRWYALYNGSDLVLSFKTPSSGGTSLVVSTSSTPSLKSGVTVSGGSEYFSGMANVGGTVSGGSSVSLSSYSGGNGGGGGWGPGGGGGRW